MANNEQRQKRYNTIQNLRRCQKKKIQNLRPNLCIHITWTWYSKIPNTKPWLKIYA